MCIIGKEEEEEEADSVPIEKCMWKERIFVDISSCRDGDETCVISAACLTCRLRQMTERNGRVTTCCFEEK